MSVLNVNEQRAGIPVMCTVWDINTLDWVRMTQPSGGGGGTQDTRETRPGQSTTANVAGSASNVTVLAANSNRRAATFYNDSTAALYLKFGATASTTSFTIKMAGGSYFEIPQPCYSGIVDGIWDSATGAVRVTEIYD